ncbi:hypothetical protein [Pseudaeromonas paramecii]|uniref:DUF4198 domain-containing protein n=1 Tax=Pseudaeromonas paramecii TaxID=2138166 RepID=A0ABP8PZU1_9GAMM
MTGWCKMALLTLLLGHSLTLWAKPIWHLDKSWLAERGLLVQDAPVFAALLATADEAAVLSAWAAPQEPVVVPVAHQIRAGDPVSLMFVLGGCQANMTGHCDVQVQMLISRPDGSVYVEPQPFAVWQGPPPTSRDGVQLGQGSLRLTFATDDPPGEYLAVAQLWDKVADRRLLLKRPFVLLSAEPDAVTSSALATSAAASTTAQPSAQP